MPNFNVAIFAENDFSNPQNPGFLPAEDATYKSDCVNGDQMTWLGGGESALIAITDNVDSTFDEAQSNQTLQSGVTFDGITYAAGQVVTQLMCSSSVGRTVIPTPLPLTGFNFSGNNNSEIPHAAVWEGSIPPAGTVLTLTSEINPTGASSRDYNDFVTCFCTGTLIDTKSGPKPIEELKTADPIRCKRGGYTEVRMITNRHVSTAELSKKS